MTIKEYAAKYGTRGTSYAVNSLIGRTMPHKERDKGVVELLRTMMVELESALETSVVPHACKSVECCEENAMEVEA